MRGGARWPHARRTLCTLSVRSRAPYLRRWALIIVLAAVGERGRRSYNRRLEDLGLTLILLLYAATLFVGAAAVPRSAARRQTATAARRRHARRVEHLHGVLPNRAPRRVPLRAPQPGKLGVRRQTFHLLVLITALVVFKIAVAATGSPVPVVPLFSPTIRIPRCWSLAPLSLSVGVPFFVLSTTSPLLQRWFATTGHPSARDPYFLYAASNPGACSVCSRTRSSSNAASRWRTSSGCSRWAYSSTPGWFSSRTNNPSQAERRRRPPPRKAAAEASERAAAPMPNGPGPRAAPALPPTAAGGGWVALAALPSSLLLGVTTHVSTDLAPVPLLWVVPLALYLVSFIVVFARWPDNIRRAVGRFTPMLILFVVLTLLTYAAEPMAVVGLLHMAAFFGVCLVCHGELAKDRPPPEHLTAFYFWMSLGGVLGGLFNAMSRPVLAPRHGRIPAGGRVGAGGRRCGRAANGCYPLKVADVILVLVLFGELTLGLNRLPRPGVDRIDVITTWIDHRFAARATDSAWADVRPPLGGGALALGAEAWRAYSSWRASSPARSTAGTSVNPHKERNFFGVIRVTRDVEVHETLPRHHAARPAAARRKRRPRPMTYYHERVRSGTCSRRYPAERVKKVGVVGLGTGAVAFYASPGNTVTFYEIDRLVRDIAFDRAYFTYTTDATARGVSQRVELRAMRGCGRNGSSGSGPASATVSSPWTPLPPMPSPSTSSPARPCSSTSTCCAGRGLALHVSNRYLELVPVVANLAEDASLGGRLLGDDESEEVAGATRSHLGGPGADGRGARRPREGTSAGPPRGSSPIRASACGPTTSTTCCRSSSGVDLSDLLWPDVVVRRVQIPELKAHLGKYLAQVSTGDTVIVCDRHTPIARLVPYAETDDGFMVHASTRPAKTLRTIRRIKTKRAVDVVALLRDGRDQR